MKQSISTIFFLFLLFCCFLLSAAAEEEHPEQTAIRLQNFYQQIESMQFHFNQDTASGLGGRAQHGSGDAYFIRDGGNGKMRWNYVMPDHQVLVSDGTTFSMYFDKLNQLIVTPAENMQSDLTYSFFSGNGSLTDDFYIFAPDEEVGSSATDGSLAVIKLIPKEMQSQVKSIHLWVTPANLIARMEISDHFDTVTVLTFSQIETNSIDVSDEKLVAALFSFAPPEGTEIIHQ